MRTALAVQQSPFPDNPSSEGPSSGDQSRGDQSSDGLHLHAARRAARRYRHLVPAASSASALVDYFRALDAADRRRPGSFKPHCGEWVLDDLFQTYVVLCEIAGFEPLTYSALSEGLVAAGCRRWQANRRLATSETWRRTDARPGARWRPLMIFISPIEAGVAPIAMIVPAPRPEPERRALGAMRWQREAGEPIPIAA